MNWKQAEELRSEILSFLTDFLDKYSDICEEDSEIVYVGKDYFERTRLINELAGNKLFSYYLDYLENLQERILNGEVDYDTEIKTLNEHSRNILSDYVICNRAKSCGLLHGDLDVPTIRAEYCRLVEEYGDDVQYFYRKLQGDLKQAKTEAEKQKVWDKYAGEIAESRAKREERLREEKEEAELLADMSAEERAQYHTDKLEALDAELKKYGWD
ncbi:hypothetical protein LAV77_02320 [Priestia megaterium]|uniref:hypothetical protein n=1 Tax=Priestia megaterium TaxID=1404 RepID=UPI002B241BB9|nr:hypothetical protein [Priestia megaterium]MEB2263620.1 hypothetical protein [Priestia megaterium]